MASDWIARVGARARAWGLAIGLALPLASAPKALGNAGDTFVPPVLTRQDSLFLIAATGEPRFQPIRDSAEKLLVAEDTATLDYLLSRRLAGQTPRQRHYVETLFKAISDSGRHPRAAAKLDAALGAAPDSLKAQLLHIGSELGDSSFLPAARRFLAHDSEDVRRNAARSLGSYPSQANAAWLIAGLDQTRDLERAERLWALGKQKDFKDWPRVLPILRDSNLYNRELARHIVAHDCGDWANVEKLAPSPMDDDELLEWVLMADDSPGMAAKLWVRKYVPMLSPARMRFIGSALRLQ
jgi:HEAT repeat protein